MEKLNQFEIPKGHAYTFVKKMFEENTPETIEASVLKFTMPEMPELMPQDFIALCASAYVIGFDVAMLRTHNKTVKSNFLARKKDCGITDKTIAATVKVLDAENKNTWLSYGMIEDTEAEYETMFSSEVVARTAHKLQLQNMVALVKKLVKNSALPARFAMDVSSTIKAAPTYKSIIKLNTLFMRDLIFLGHKSNKSYHELYSDGYWNKTLKTSVDRHHTTEFMGILSEAALTLSENIPTAGAENLINFMVDESFEMPTIETGSSENGEENADTFVAPSSEEQDENIESFPEKHIADMLSEMIGKNIETVEDVKKACGIFINSSVDEIESKYHYIRSAIKNIKDSDRKYLSDGLVAESVEYFNNMLDEQRNILKSAQDKLYEKLPDTEIDRIINLLRSAIRGVICKTIEQKRIITSVIVAFNEKTNPVQTYSQLYEIMEHIERMDIMGEYVHEFASLHNYIAENETIKKVFDEASDLSPVMDQHQLAKALADYFNACAFSPETESEQKA